MRIAAGRLTVQRNTNEVVRTNELTHLYNGVLETSTITDIQDTMVHVVEDNMDDYIEIPTTKAYDMDDLDMCYAMWKSIKAI